MELSARIVELMTKARQSGVDHEVIFHVHCPGRGRRKTPSISEWPVTESINAAIMQEIDRELTSRQRKRS